MPSDDLMALDDDVLEPSLRKKRGGGALAGLAFVIAFAAAALSLWIWWQSRESDAGANAALQTGIDSLRQAQAGQSRDLETLKSRLAAAGDPSEQTQALAGELAEVQSRNAELERQIEAHAAYSSTLQQAIEAMQARLATVESRLAAQAPVALDEPAQLDMAGVEYLLRLAPERLALFHDVRSADRALALADARLEAMDNPLHLGLRQRIADARQDLSETTLPNPVELSARLDAVQARVADLEFQSGQAAATDANSGAGDAQVAEAGWWDRLKATLSGLVTVRRSAEDSASRLTLQDKDILRQGLWMQIEAARLALMRNDQPAWSDAMSRATATLERWFEPSSQAYSAVSDGLQQLSSVDIDPDLPDISAPRAQLQLIEQAR